MINSELLSRRILPIIFVLDTSGSMSGEKIAEFNSEMNAISQWFRALDEEYRLDCDPIIGILTYSTGAKWYTYELIDKKDFFWEDIPAGGLSDFGAAIKEISRRFTRNDLFTFIKGGGVCRPVIICVSGGTPTDDWEQAFYEAESNNKWFSIAIKGAVALGDEADVSALRTFCKPYEPLVIKDTLKNSIMHLVASIVLDSGRYLGLKKRVASSYSIQLNDCTEIKLWKNEEVVLSLGQIYPRKTEDAELAFCSLCALESDWVSIKDGVEIKFFHCHELEISINSKNYCEDIAVENVEYLLDVGDSVVLNKYGESFRIIKDVYSWIDDLVDKKNVEYEDEWLDDYEEGQSIILNEVDWN